MTASEICSVLRIWQVTPSGSHPAIQTASSELGQKKRKNTKKVKEVKEKK